MIGVAARAVAPDLRKDGLRRGVWPVRVLRGSEYRSLRPPQNHRDRDRTGCEACEKDRHCAARGRAWRRIPPIPIGSNAGFRTTTNHHVGIAAGDDAEGIADGVRAGSAGGSGGGIRAFRAGAHRNITGGKIHNSGRNKERRDTPRATLQIVAVLALDDFKTCQCRCRHTNADTLRIFFIHLKARVHGERVFQRPQSRTG